MKGWITSTVGERPYKAWAWHKSIFKDCDITFHATWQEAFDHLRDSGAMCIDDIHSGVSIITNNTRKRRGGEMKKKTVWTVCEGDTGCDEPGYIATCSVFATRETAMQSMEKAVARDEDCFETPAKWNAERDMAIIELGNGRQIVYTINEEEVRA